MSIVQIHKKNKLKNNFKIIKILNGATILKQSAFEKSVFTFQWSASLNYVIFRIGCISDKSVSASFGFR